MLKIARKKARLTQRELAELIEVNQAYISSLETYKKEPSLRIILKISKELDLCPTALFKDYMCKKCNKECKLRG